MSGSPASLFTTKKLCLTAKWSWSITLGAVCRSCPSPIFWLPFKNRYTHIEENLCQISHFILKVYDFQLSSFTIIVDVTVNHNVAFNSINR